MKKIKIRLLQLGYPSIVLRKIVGWRSKFFEFEKDIHAKSILPKSDGEGWSYSKKTLSKVVGKNSDVDITLAVMDKPMEGNYYLHRLSQKTCVLSLYEMSGILAAENIPPEVFLIRNIYEIVVIYYEFAGKLTSDAHGLHHEDTRGCLYDFNPIKSDIIASTKQVKLCAACRARLLQRQLPIGFVDDLETELKRIRKPLVFRVMDFVKEHPVRFLIISLTVSAVVNVVSNCVYDILKFYFSKLRG